MLLVQLMHCIHLLLLNKLIGQSQEVIIIIYENDPTIHQYISYHPSLTQIIGEGSLLGRLKKDFPHVMLDDYISFFALRNYGYLYQKFV